MQILSQKEREQIEWFLKLKLKIREIGRRLDRDHGVISRELKRNTLTGHRYSAAVAQRLADRKSHHTNKRKLEADEPLHDWVIKHLQAGWSPEQIAGRLKSHPPKFLQGKYINHESIYQYIYDGEGRYEYLYPCLRRKQKKRRRKYGRKPQKTFIPERISIHLRPEVVNERRRYGDWESDTLNFGRHKQAVSVQYERTFMLSRLHKLVNKTAEATEDALSDSVESLPMEFWKSITFDNGAEAAFHTRIRDGYNLETYFCDAYASWQKGGVENLNGLLREYLPKKTDPATITEDRLCHIQESLNTRPRKKLGYLTPNETVRAEINKLTGALNS